MYFLRVYGMKQNLFEWTKKKNKRGKSAIKRFCSTYCAGVIKLQLQWLPVWPWSRLDLILTEYMIEYRCLEKFQYECHKYYQVTE